MSVSDIVTHISRDFLYYECVFHPAIDVHFHDLLLRDPPLQNSPQRGRFVAGTCLIQCASQAAISCLWLVLWKHRVIGEDAVRIGVVPQQGVFILVGAWAEVGVLCYSSHYSAGEQVRWRSVLWLHLQESSKQRWIVLPFIATTVQSAVYTDMCWKIQNWLVIRLTQGNMGPSVRDYECALCVLWSGCVCFSSVCLYCWVTGSASKSPAEYKGGLKEEQPASE